MDVTSLEKVSDCHLYFSVISVEYGRLKITPGRVFKLYCSITNSPVINPFSWPQFIYIYIYIYIKTKFAIFMNSVQYR